MKFEKSMGVIIERLHLNQKVNMFSLPSENSVEILITMSKKKLPDDLLNFAVDIQKDLSN